MPSVLHGLAGAEGRLQDDIEQVNALRARPRAELLFFEDWCEVFPVPIAAQQWPPSRPHFNADGIAALFDRFRHFHGTKGMTAWSRILTGPTGYSPAWCNSEA